MRRPTGLVEKAAMAAQKDPAVSFLDRLKKDQWIARYISPKEMEKLFDPAYYVRHLDQIYDRVFKE